MAPCYLCGVNNYLNDDLPESCLANIKKSLKNIKLDIDRNQVLYIIAPSVAGIAQLVEHDLAKVGVASSNLVSRSKFQKPRSVILTGVFLYKDLAE